MKPFTLEGWGIGAPTLELELPSSTTYDRTESPDGDTHLFCLEGATIKIYVGQFPEPKGNSVPNRTSRLILGKRSEIFQGNEDDSGVDHRTFCILENPFGELESADPAIQDLLVRIQVVADSAARADEIWGWIESRLREGALRTE